MQDELPEFGSSLIEVLRQPPEGLLHEVAISRTGGTATFPTNFMLIAAQNLCPYGYQSYCNAEMGPSEVLCVLDATGKQLMKSAMRQMSLSARAFHRILKLAAIQVWLGRLRIWRRRRVFSRRIWRRAAAGGWAVAAEGAGCGGNGAARECLCPTSEVGAQHSGTQA